MYEPNTILTLKEQHPDIVVPQKEDPDTGRIRKQHKIPFPYNKVRVVGRSPVDHGQRGGGWEGVGAAGVIIEPLTGFGSNLDEPYGKLQKLYEVTEIPTNEIEVTPVRVIRSTSQSAGPTPEEVFAVSSPGTPLKDGETRGRTPFKSPLPDVEDETETSPLGK